MKNKIFLTLILSMFLIGLVSAVDCDGTFLGTFKQGDSIELKQICDSCSYVTLSSISYPNSSSIYINENMTKSGVDYNYSFSDTETMGHYGYSVFGDKDGSIATETFCFQIGTDLTTGKAISYIGFIIILLFIFILTLGGAIKVNWEHGRNSEGKIITVNDFRYVKVFLFCMAYLEIMFLFGLSYKLFNEANIEGFTQFFNFVYQLFLNLIYPIIIVAIIFTFVIWINNLKLKKKRKLGL